MKRFLPVLVLWFMLCSAVNVACAEPPGIPPSAPNQSTAFLPSVYTGFLSTRTELPVTHQPNTTATWNVSWHAYFARDVINTASAHFLWPCFALTSTNVEQGPGANCSLTWAIEYPQGTVTPCSGGSPVTVTNGTITTLSCSGSVKIPNGALFWIGSLQTNTAGIVTSGINTGYFSSAYETNQYGTGAAPSLTTRSAVPAASAYLYGVAAIVGPTTKPSLGLVGDSRMTSILSSQTDASLDVGEVAQMIGPKFAYARVSVASSLCAQYLTNHTQRDIILQYASHIVDAYGINDLPSYTSAQVAACRSSLAALYPGKVIIGTTLYPVTTSTDGWVTTTNQTVKSTATQVPAFNALVRAGITGESNYFDLSDGLDPYRLGVWPVALNPAATSGTSVCNTDGTHAAQTCENMVRDRRIGIDLPKITRN